MTVSFSIDSDSSGRGFSIHPITGRIVADSSRLDYEAASSQEVTVRQSDTSDPSLYSTVVINITVGNIQCGSYRDVNGDGRLDLVVRIDGAKTGLAVGDTLARLTGTLSTGLQIFGSSSVIVKK